MMSWGHSVNQWHKHSVFRCGTRLCAHMFQLSPFRLNERTEQRQNRPALGVIFTELCLQIMFVWYQQHHYWFFFPTVLFFRTTCFNSWRNTGDISRQVQGRRSLLAQCEDWHNLGLCGTSYIYLGGGYNAHVCLIVYHYFTVIQLKIQDSTGYVKYIFSANTFLWWFKLLSAFKCLFMTMKSRNSTSLLGAWGT